MSCLVMVASGASRAKGRFVNLAAINRLDRAVCVVAQLVTTAQLAVAERSVADVPAR